MESLGRDNILIVSSTVTTATSPNSQSETRRCLMNKCRKKKIRQKQSIFMFCFQWEDPHPNWYQTMKSYMFNKKNIQQVKCVTGKLLRKQNNIQAKLNFNADLARCENVIPLSSVNPSNERRGKCHYSQKTSHF